MSGTHFIYAWSLEDNHQTVDQFFTDLSSGKTETVLLGTNFRRVSDGDWLWFSFTKSDGDIVAVAQTVGEPFQEPGIRRKWQVQVRWMAGLTARLRRLPLALNLPEQSRQGSPQRAVPNLERVLKKWLNGNYSPQARKADETVRLVRRSVLQRQGQQEFRRRLLTAYGGAMCCHRLQRGGDAASCAHPPGFIEWGPSHLERSAPPGRHSQPLRPGPHRH